MPSVSTLFELLTDKSGIRIVPVDGSKVDESTGYNGIGRGVGGFIGRYGGRVGRTVVWINGGETVPVIILKD